MRIDKTKLESGDNPEQSVDNPEQSSGVTDANSIG